MEYLAGLYTLLLVAICLELAVVLWRTGKKQDGAPDHDELKRWMQQQLDAQAKEFAARQSALAEQNHTALRSVSETLQTAVQNMSTTLAQGQDSQQQLLERRLRSLEAANTQKLEELRRSMAESMTALQAENNRKLDEIRHTVDEQLQDTLQKRVSESFKAVNEQLEQVYKGLGEMQNLAADVGGLKQVLSGVKTRGILGEVQLGAILEQILAPGQYACNVATVPGSTNRVEYAIKMPGQNGTVWLPIDAKFPLETYQHVLDAQNEVQIKEAKQALAVRLRAEAISIKSKYIRVPKTTDFAILYLPIEGLFAEAMQIRGLSDELLNNQRIILAGPTTLAALLNSLQMGFRTVQIEKRSSEIYKLLGAFKKDFETFCQILEKTQKKLGEVTTEIERAGKRTEYIQKRLDKVTTDDEGIAAELSEGEL